MAGFLNWWDAAELWLSGRRATDRDRHAGGSRAGLRDRSGDGCDSWQWHFGGAASARRAGPASMTGLPRSRVRFALVALIVLIVLVWLLNR